MAILRGRLKLSNGNETDETDIDLREVTPIDGGLRTWTAALVIPPSPRAPMDSFFGDLAIIVADGRLGPWLKHQREPTGLTTLVGSGPLAWCVHRGGH